MPLRRNVLRTALFAVFLSTPACLLAGPLRYNTEGEFGRIDQDLRSPHPFARAWISPSSTQGLAFREVTDGELDAGGTIRLGTIAVDPGPGRALTFDAADDHGGFGVWLDVPGLAAIRGGLNPRAGQPGEFTFWEPIDYAGFQLFGRLEGSIDESGRGDLRLLLERVVDPWSPREAFPTLGFPGPRTNLLPVEISALEFPRVVPLTSPEGGPLEVPLSVRVVPEPAGWLVGVGLVLAGLASSRRTGRGASASGREWSPGSRAG